MTDQQQEIPQAALTTAIDAQARLTSLTADRAWSDKLLEGHADTYSEFQKLTEIVASGDQVEIAIAGLTPGDIPNSDQKHMTETASLLRELGIRDEVIRETLSGQGVTQAEMDATVAWRARMMKDPTFTKAFLEGDAEAGRKMMLSSIIISSQIKQGAAA